MSALLAVAIDLQHVVGVVLFLLLAALIFGLLYFLIHYIGKKFSGEASAMIVTVADIILVVLAVLLLIGLLLSFAGVGPEFHWGGRQNPTVR